MPVVCKERIGQSRVTSSLAFCYFLKFFVLFQLQVGICKLPKNNLNFYIKFQKNLGDRTYQILRILHES